MSAPPPDPATGVDLQALLDRIHGNKDVLRELVQLMLAHLPERISAVEEAFAAHDLPTLATASHSLRGSLANFTTGPAWFLAGQLEAAAGANNFADAEAHRAALQSAVQRVEADLRRWLQGGEL